MLISVKIKNSHVAYNDHNIANQPTLSEIGRDEIL